MSSSEPHAWADSGCGCDPTFNACTVCGDDYYAATHHAPRAKKLSWLSYSADALPVMSDEDLEAHFRELLLGPHGEGWSWWAVHVNTERTNRWQERRRQDDRAS